MKLDDLVPLGPTFLLRAKHDPDDFDRRVTVEFWLYPDGSRTFEIATKCLPKEAFQVAAEFRAFLTKCGIDLTGKQSAKTRSALDFHSSELREAARP